MIRSHILFDYGDLCQQYREDSDCPQAGFDALGATVPSPHILHFLELHFPGSSNRVLCFIYKWGHWACFNGIYWMWRWRAILATWAIFTVRTDENITLFSPFVTTYVGIQLKQMRAIAQYIVIKCPHCGQLGLGKAYYAASLNCFNL